MSDSLPIAEVFSSIQGEGLLSGTPAFFIRVSGCNLRCAWCDTPYASWSPEGTQRTIGSLIVEAIGAAATHIVLTGGEPMLFPAVEPLCRGLADLGMHITIETAGTIHRRIACDLMSISPKLANSTPRGDARDPGGAWAERHEERRLNLGALQALIDDHAGRQLKFVVAEPSDLAEIEWLLGRLAGVAPGDVHLMPEGTDPRVLESRRWIPGACRERGWRFCPRLHIQLFGNRRGT